MKRLITLLLAMVMALSLVVPAWAVTLTDTAESTIQPVKVKTTTPATVYSVSVTWDSLDFVYVRGNWYPARHNYDGAGWQNNRNAAQVTVQNHSNAPIWYTAVLDADIDINDGLTVALTNPIGGDLSSGIELATPEVNSSQDSRQSQFTVRVEGTPNAHVIKDAIPINNLTVTILTEEPPHNP